MNRFEPFRKRLSQPVAQRLPLFENCVLAIDSGITDTEAAYVLLSLTPVAPSAAGENRSALEFSFLGKGLQGPQAHR